MTKEEKRSIMIQAVNEFGFNSQLDQLTEELAELIVACNKLRRKKEDALNNLIDEMADVDIMTTQIKINLGIESAVDNRVVFKLKRLKERL